MRRGEVWWVEFDEPRPVVLLSGDERSGFETMQIVSRSATDITGLGMEVPVGPIEGVPYEGVIRLGFGHPDFMFCTWLTTVPAASLLSQAGTLPSAKIDEIDKALRFSREEQAWTPDATARLAGIRAALRSGELGGLSKG
jgi:mRNA interferase MazF